MIDSDDRKVIEELKAQVHCGRSFSCVNAAFADLCASKYHSELDILECLEKYGSCHFARPFGCVQVCICPLRKLIAKNFDRWSADDTAVLRAARSGDSR